MGIKPWRYRYCNTYSSSQWPLWKWFWMCKCCILCSWKRITADSQSSSTWFQIQWRFYLRDRTKQADCNSFKRYGNTTRHKNDSYTSAYSWWNVCFNKHWTMQCFDNRFLHYRRKYKSSTQDYWNGNGSNTSRDSY